MAVMGVDDRRVGQPQGVLAQVPPGVPVQGVDADAGELGDAGSAEVARVGQPRGVEVAPVLQLRSARRGFAGVGEVGARDPRFNTSEHTRTYIRSLSLTHSPAAGDRRLRGGASEPALDGVDTRLLVAQDTAGTPIARGLRLGFSKEFWQASYDGRVVITGDAWRWAW